MEPLSIGLLAGTVVKIVGPYLSAALGKTADSLVDDAASSASKSAMKGADRLLNLVRSKFSGKPAAESALKRLAADEHDPDAANDVRRYLADEIRGDTKFASELSTEIRLIAETNADLAFVNNIHGDVAKLVQIGTVHGDVHI